MFVYIIQSYHIAVNMHASPVVPIVWRVAKTKVKATLQRLYFAKIRTLSTFDCLFVFCYFKSYLESNFLSCKIKTKLFVNQNVCFKLIKKNMTDVWKSIRNIGFTKNIIINITCTFQPF